MRIGIPKEIKVKESRISCTPGGVRALIAAGHQVLIQQGAGENCGFDDESYLATGAQIVETAAQAWDAAMVIKVKEPIHSEYQFLRPNLLLFTYLHLAADLELSMALIESKTTAVAYETIQLGRRLPLLEPMSEIAGRMSAIVGASYLNKVCGGKGVLLGGVPGVAPGHVVILGGGTAGLNAGRVAAGLGADVTILELDLDRMRYLDLTTGGRIRTLYSNQQNLLDLLPSIDVLIGAVLVPGSRAPRLIQRETLRNMKEGSVFVDIAIDQGGCAETSRPTTHEEPHYIEEGIVHYCVANMPGAYARTATQALTNATLPYALELANFGLEAAVEKMPELRSGVNTLNGRATCQAVAEAHGLAFEEYTA